MTLRLYTESHGEVESGFFSIFVQFTRLGRYAFVTRHFCGLTEYLAKNPHVRKSKILGYNLDKFCERFGDEIGEIMQVLAEKEESYLPELHDFEMDRLFERYQREVPLEDDIDLYNEGELVPVEINGDRDLIIFGDYIIAKPHFGMMVEYVVNGGFLGWANDQKPDFAESAIQAIKESENPLLSEAKKYLGFGIEQD